MPQIDRGSFAELPRVNVSVKLSALDSQFDPIDPEGTTERVAARLRQLLRVARANRAFVHVDMESYQTKDLTLAIFQQVLTEDEFRDTPDVGIVIQCYLRDAADDLRGAARLGPQRGTPVWVRLVKGAYWDYETVHAQAAGWPMPVFQQKWETDANFERLTRFLLRNHECLRPALASHNIRSLAHGMAVARHIGRAARRGFELQMLYGMADAEKQVLVDLGYRLRIYMPYGELIPGMAYLVRRLLENTSNDSFLRASFTEHVVAGEIADESAAIMPATHAARRHRRAATRASCRRDRRPNFATSRWPISPSQANRQAMQEALRRRARATRPALSAVDRRPARSIPTERIASINPSHQRQVVGTVAAGRGRRSRCAPWPRPGGPGRPGPPLGGRSGPSFCDARPARCAAGDSSWPPGKSSSAARAGARPTPTSARRSTSAEYYARRRRAHVQCRTESTCRAKRIASSICRAAWRR